MRYVHLIAGRIERRQYHNAEPSNPYSYCLDGGQVSKQVVELQHAFDERLDRQVKELMESYDKGDMSVIAMRQAKSGAAQARNEALNLSCPHCATVYTEFDGCLALACATCKRHFCGFCHKAFESSRGTHQHVRECDANTTANGSYYANAAEIKEAQRRYRVKRLKKFLREQKGREIQNAIIIELGPDLNDLGVDPAALFDFGVLID